MNVDFAVLVAGEGEVEAVEEAGREVVGAEVLDNEVCCAALVAEEEPVAAGSVTEGAFLEESLKGGASDAGTDHDDVLGVVGGEFEGVGHEEDGDGWGVEGSPVSQISAGGAGEKILSALVANDVDDEVNGVGVDALGGGNGVEAGLQLAECVDVGLGRQNAGEGVGGLEKAVLRLEIRQIGRIFGIEQPSECFAIRK